MKYSSAFYLLATLLLFPLNALPQGMWTDYTSTRDITDIEVHGNDLWYSTTGGIVRWNISEKTYVKFTRKDGLPNNIVYSLAIDKDGIVWAGLIEGRICRFDGDAWEEVAHLGVSLTSWVKSLEIDLEGVVWVGTSNNGLFSIEGETITSIKSQEGLNVGVRAIIVDNENEKWFGTPSGLIRYDRGKMVLFTVDHGLADNNIYSMALGPDNALWIGTRNGLSRFDGYFWTSYLQGLDYNYQVDHISVRPDGKIIIIIDGNFAQYVDGIAWDNYDFTQYQRSFSTNGMACDSNDIIWLARGNGIFYYQNNTLDQFTGVEGLTGNDVRSLLVDPDGTVWAGTYFDGLSTIENGTWSTYRIEDDLHWYDNIYPITKAPDETTWIGIGRGVAWNDGKEWQRFKMECVSYSDANTARDIEFASDGSVWIASICDNGLYHYEDGIWINPAQRDGQYYRDIRSLDIDANDVIWLAVYQEGIVRYDGDSWTMFTEQDGLANNKALKISVAPDNTVWAVTGSQASKYDGKSWHAFTEEDGISGANRFHFEIDSKSNVWTGSDEGIFYYDGVIWMRYSVAEGFPEGRITALAIDQHDDVWVGLSGEKNEGLGICHFDGERWTSYSYEDGLVSNYIRCFAFGPDGDVWIGTRDGLSRFDPESTTVTETTDKPSEITIHGNYPNPFNAATTIGFNLPDDADTEIAVYNITGQKIRTLMSKHMTSGSHTVRWDGRDDDSRDVSSGAYIARVRSGGYYASHIVMLVR